MPRCLSLLAAHSRTAYLSVVVSVVLLFSTFQAASPGLRTLVKMLMYLSGAWAVLCCILQFNHNIEPAVVVCLPHRLPVVVVLLQLAVAVGTSIALTVDAHVSRREHRPRQLAIGGRRLGKHHGWKVAVIYV